MKKIWVFILGAIIGIVLTILFAAVATYISSSVNGSNSNLNIFEEPGDCLISKSSLEIFQTLEQNVALAMIKDSYSSGAYLVVNKENKSYYDGQVIKLPAGKCFKQIGTYRYQNKENDWKTVPVVQIM